jgi:predicted Fe-Mo cluster-binding NifX family protein
MMILLISSQQPHMDSMVEERFGRSPWFIKINTDTNEWKPFANPGAAKAGGAGVATTQFVVDLEANAVASGYYGPNAADALRAAKVDMYFLPHNKLTVQQALDAFLQGQLQMSGPAA